MANLTRSAKSGTHWSENELLAFNIRVQDTGVADFFNVPDHELPPPTVSATLLTHIDEPDSDGIGALPIGALPKNDCKFFEYMKWVENGNPGSGSRGSRVCDFIAFLLRMMDYDEGHQLLRWRMHISFPMAGKLVNAYVHVVLTREASRFNVDPGKFEPEFLLLVQEDKSIHSASARIPEPQLIASAIAAFYQNNLLRTKRGLRPLESAYIPALIMCGTAPTFYRIPVTTKLVDAVAAGTYPQEETTVMRFVPPVPDQARYRSDGMRPLDNRRIVFQCFEAFKGAIN